MTKPLRKSSKFRKLIELLEAWGYGGENLIVEYEPKFKIILLLRRFDQIDEDILLKITISNRTVNPLHPFYGSLDCTILKRIGGNSFEDNYSLFSPNPFYMPKSTFGHTRKLMKFILYVDVVCRLETKIKTFNG
jgi:hypothetical protein